jgi:hypothetical protein
MVARITTLEECQHKLSKVILFLGHEQIKHVSNLIYMVVEFFTYGLIVKICKTLRQLKVNN